MCGSSKTELHPCDSLIMGETQEQGGRASYETSVLLELSAMDNLSGFKMAIEDKGFDVDGASLWYGRRIGSRNVGFEERTPLMIASLYGSTKVLKYIIGTGKADVSRACSSDGATALHCAAVSGLDSTVEVVELLLDASADVDAVDANGNKPRDLIAPNLKSSSYLKRKKLELLLRGRNIAGESALLADFPINQMNGEESEKQPKEVTEKKEYPIDVPLPDINNGLYGTDEFRMYSFKVKPCSRAYSHDWTECPFVHPGENARRRDLRKYQYSCVPCPEFRKGNCAKGDDCEYAHGVFESWLHPAQYRTRLCKDETGCSRKICFFAHKTEELRPVYASTGSGIPSPRSLTTNSLDVTMLGPLAPCPSSLLMPPTSTQPLSPSTGCSSPMAGSLWQNKVNVTPSSLQLPSSRLKTSLSARDLELEMELLGLESLHNQQQRRQQLMNEITGLSSPSRWNKEYSRIGELKRTNLEDVFGSLDPSLLSELQGLSPRVNQWQSPTALQMRQSMNQLHASYPSTNITSSPTRKSPAYGFESSGAVVAAVMSSRSAAFAKRSQSFIDRGAVHHRPGSLGLTAAANSAGLMSSNLSNWSPPDGKLDWGFKGEELNKLKKSASFGYRSGNSTAKMVMGPSAIDEPDVSWVHSLVKDGSSMEAGLYSSKQEHGRLHEALPPWLEQLYIEQEQMVA